MHEPIRDIAISSDEKWLYALYIQEEFDNCGIYFIDISDP